MTLEDRPLYKAGEKPSTVGKYGPSATRDIEFVSKGGLNKPIVSVKQKKNGQYVVVEKLPAKNFQQRNKFATVEQSLAETGVNFRSLKPSWKYWAKKNENEPPVPNSGHSYRPGRYPRSLPPIDLGWKAEPLVGSLLNSEHRPGGGDVRIHNEKLKWQAKSKVGSLDNIDYNRTRSSQSDPSNERPSQLGPSPRYGALASIGGYNSYYTPSGAQVVTSNKQSNPKYDHVQARVGSLDNANHAPQGGDVTIQHHRLKWKRESRVGSLDNIHHQPQGGDIYIVNQRLTWQAKPRIGSLDNIHHAPQKTVGKVPHYKTAWDGRPRVGSLDNIHHTPRGGNVVIPTKRLRWKAESKINSLPTKRASLEDLSLHSDSLGEARLSCTGKSEGKSENYSDCRTEVQATNGDGAAHAL
ncbi:hypothetical protein RRG08_019860 [Elysia crispata]|uniref:Microtubule-associated protein n=1 Tax=Elysia crispata TaxID=231223 RepID=A0AAE1DZW6_9GAST|nr:hypothetical protein RRG08_019860 [Elysia crispata]